MILKTYINFWNSYWHNQSIQKLIHRNNVPKILNRPVDTISWLHWLYYLQSSGAKQISFFAKNKNISWQNTWDVFFLFLCKYCCECCWNICRGGTCGSHWEEYDVSLQIYTMEYCYQLPTSQFMATYNSLSQFGSDVTGNFVSCVDVV